MLLHLPVQHELSSSSFPNQRWIKKFLTDTLPSDYLRARYGRVVSGRCPHCDGRNTFLHRFQCQSVPMQQWVRQVTSDLLPKLQKCSNRPLLTVGGTVPKFYSKYKQCEPYWSRGWTIYIQHFAMKPGKPSYETGRQSQSRLSGNISTKSGNPSLTKCIRRIRPTIHSNRVYIIKHEGFINSQIEFHRDYEIPTSQRTSILGCSLNHLSPSVTGSSRMARGFDARSPSTRNRLQPQNQSPPIFHASKPFLSSNFLFWGSPGSQVLPFLPASSLWSLFGSR